MMSTDGLISPALAKLVEETGGPVTPDQIDGRVKIMEAENQQQKVQAVLSAWSTQERQDRDLRKKYANWIIGGFIAQSVAINCAFFLLGAGKLSVDPWVANTFVIGVFSELSALCLIVFKYLFPRRSSDLGKLVESL